MSSNTCPDCGETGGTKRVVGVDKKVTYWHPECFRGFKCWLRGHDDLCKSEEVCMKKFKTYLGRAT